MQKINFKNLPDASTPLNASALNQMQDNIESAIDTVASDIPTIENSLNSDSTINGASVHAVKEGLKRTYSTTQEFIIGTYYDDKPVYRKTVFISSLPNSQQQGYAHNIPNIDNIVDINAIAYSNSGVASRLPYLGINDTLNIGVFASPTEITFLTNADRSSWSSYVDLYYTKTTD